MEVCEKLEDTNSNCFAQMPALDVENTSCDSLHRNFVRDATDSISRSTETSLDENQLLSIFGGNRENLDYYCQLRQIVSNWNENELGPLVCDPRDSKKLQQVGKWQPQILVEDIGEVIKQCQSANCGAFISKQTAVVEQGQEAGQNDDHDLDEKDSLVKNEMKSFPCGVSGCGKTFTSLALHEAHYHRCHNYACATCRRSFVSGFLLDVHIQENHDSYFQILSSRIDMYCCLVEACSHKFRTAELRKDHLVTVHQFPSNFSFHQPLKDVRLEPSPSNADEGRMNVSVDFSESEPMETSRKDNGSIGPKGKNGSNKRVPATVCFGRGSQRGFQRRGRGGRGHHWHQVGRPDVDTTVDIESVDMKELAETLG